MFNTIHTINLFTNVSVGAGATSSGVVVDLFKYQMTGYMSLQLKISGSGTARVYYTSSNDGLTYQVAEDANDVITAMTVGEKIINVNPVFSRYMQFYVAETGSSNSITIVKAVLAVE